ncbi:ABC transporter permease [Desulfosarcina ovata]|uniref:Membrane protein n=1 Tax=Desulfosarcina ovata subsp. ovata TaxID=2752305 RepID=A0A5K8ABD6_9BACT|nr:FtsX-like permease family protein [Desulfosarcina ovata]BBO89798.1 membrane protein [Desulfosarcina ovata subsp. ovata]
MKTDGIWLWIRIALCFLGRSGRATAALSVMVVTAVAALIFLAALSVGVEDAMLRNTVGLFSGHITVTAPSVSDRPEGLRIPDVSAVLERIWVNGALSASDHFRPVVLCGIDSDKECAHTALKHKIIAGRYPLDSRDETLISRDLTRDLDVGMGDTVQFEAPSVHPPIRLRVVGIYQTGLDALDRGIAFCPLACIPARTGKRTDAVFLNTGVDTEAVIEAYRRQLPGTVHIEAWYDQMPDLRQLIDLEAVSMALVIFIVFAVVAIGVACSFVVFIIRNMREYGIMKAMGVSATEMAGLIVIKVVLMNLFACGLGTLIGIAGTLAVAHTGGIDLGAFTSHNRYFTVSGVIYPRLTVFSLLAPPVTALVFGLMSAIWPAVMVSRKRVAEILRMI